MQPIVPEKTISETLFETFCTERGIPFTVVPRADTVTPDYDIELSGHIIVAEMKQCDPNQADVDSWNAARVRGSGGAWEEPGRRVRLKIQNCKKQLKARSNGQFPTLLVIYDNGTFCGVDPSDIKTAMYGDEKVVITRAGSDVLVSAVHPGGGRKFTPDCGTSISAIALMHRLGHSIKMFHNHFARLPIDPEWYRGESLRHFALDPTDATAGYEWKSV